VCENPIEPNLHFHKLASLYFVDVPCDGCIKQQRACFQEGNVVEHTLLQVAEWEERNVICVGLQLAIPKLVSNISIGECEHTTVCLETPKFYQLLSCESLKVVAYVVNDDDFPGPEQLLRDYQATQGLDGSATSIADDVGIALLKSKDLGWVYDSVSWSLLSVCGEYDEH
jgi:hypothetical protein